LNSQMQAQLYNISFSAGGGGSAYWNNFQVFSEFEISVQ
jgi:hypothetical protein